MQHFQYELRYQEEQYHSKMHNNQIHYPLYELYCREEQRNSKECID